MRVQQAVRGFSLIEVLVAFTITALALGVLYQIHARGTTAALLGQEYVQAVTIARSKLAMLGTVNGLDVAEYRDVEQDKYHWTIRISDYPDTTPSAFRNPLTLKEIHLEISWHSRGKERRLEMNTLKPVVES